MHDKTFCRATAGLRELDRMPLGSIRHPSFDTIILPSYAILD